MQDRKTLGIRELIEERADFKEGWMKLDDAGRHYLMEVDEKKRVPNLLNDSIFKGVFDPDVQPERISRLISAVLGREVKVVRGLNKEGIILSENSKGILLDVPVEFEDGSQADVEIQRKGADMPPQRPAVYSANMLTRQYSRELEQNKGEVDFEALHPVYSIVLMETSPQLFHRSPDYHHHFCQTSNTGVEKGVDFELLQYYDYICLDVFKEKRPHVATMLEKWLDFFTIQTIEDMDVFLRDNQEFRAIYQKAVEMMADKTELCNAVSSFFMKEDLVASINKTNESKVRRLEKEKKQWLQERAQMQMQIQELEARLEKAGQLDAL